MILKLPASIVACLALLISLAASATGQQKRQTPTKPQTPPALAPAPTPPPTLETLLPADTYRIYGEIRSVGQLIKSNSVSEILEPILKLAGPPKEFRTALKWLNTHADEVMSSRMIVAAWTTQKDIPDTLVAIEFASPEEASKFQLQLNPFLQKMMQPETPTPTSEPNKTEPPPQPSPPPPPPYHIQQAGSLILITSTPLNLKKLRPAGSKLLAEDVDFRVARNRLNTESIFVFVDVNAIEKEEEEQRKRAEESREKLISERAAKAQPTEMPKVEIEPDPEEPEPTFIPEKHDPANVEVELGKDGTGQGIGTVGTPPPVYLALGMVLGSLSVVEAKWPAAIGVGLSLEGDSFDLRALLINGPGEKSDPIPFLPVLAPGPAIAPEAPNILPADTDMLITASLDLPYIYTAVSKPRALLEMRHGQMTVEQPGEMQSPLADLEKQLKINIKDQLLPLLGSEIAISLPMTGMDWLQPPRAATPATSQPSPLPSPEPSPDPENTSADTFTVTETTRNISLSEAAPILVLSLKDKEGMRALLPKLIESMAFKGASSLAQTERREDTELVSYVNVVAYAFIGNFLVISPDVKATRHVVDSYLKRQTLSGDIHFKNYTRWLPRQVQGQVYISPSLMESYRTWIQQPTAPVDEQTRAFLTRFSIVAQPVTYSLSNEGFGPLHELHLPKNLVLLLIAATVGNKDAPQYQVSPPDPKPVVAQPPKLPANPNDRPF